MTTAPPPEPGSNERAAEAPALLSLTYDVHDPDRLARYRDAAAPALLGEGGGVLVTSTAETEHLVEAQSRGSHTVVLRFDDADHARRVYESEAYQQVVDERLAATTPRIAMIVPGVP